MTTETAIDQAKVEAFAGKAMGDLSGATTTLMAAIGDRLGLFKVLAAGGPATSAELAARAGVNERYTREWLSAMSSAGYIAYEPTTGRFTVPPEHEAVLVQEGGPAFFGGVWQEMLGFLPIVAPLIESFKRGGGVPWSAYDDNLNEGLARFTGGWFEHALLPAWIPAVPDVQAKLEQGATVADVGCGHGRALLKLAQAFPNSRFIGYDVEAPSVARATENARAAGVAHVTFKHLDAAQGLPEQYDLITTFDVVHDTVDPRGLLRAIRRALKPDGIYLCLEINCADRLEDNAGPIGAMLYGVSVLLCMTTSLAHGGEGLGTMGLPESKLRELCAEAGFAGVERLPLDDPFNVLYAIRP